MGVIKCTKATATPDEEDREIIIAISKHNHSLVIRVLVCTVHVL